MLKLILTSIISSLLLSNCTWSGYKGPTESSYVKVGRASNPYYIGIQNLESRPKRKESVLKAAKEVQDIFYHSEFEKRLLGKTWIKSCDSGVIKTITGREVLADLRSLKVRVSIYDKKPARAVGQTDTGPKNHRIAIDPDRINNYGNQDASLAIRALLIETMAHEFGHLVLANEPRTKPKYRDSGVGSNLCSKGKLVSYKIGDFAREVWLLNQKKP